MSGRLQESEAMLCHRISRAHDRLPVECLAPGLDARPERLLGSLGRSEVTIGSGSIGKSRDACPGGGKMQSRLSRRSVRSRVALQV